MNKFRVVVYGVLLVVCTSMAGDKHAKSNANALEMAANSFYTGCMSGIIAVIEEGYFKAGKTAFEANQNFYKLKVNCMKQRDNYKRFLE